MIIEKYSTKYLEMMTSEVNILIYIIPDFEL
jgi:hypothetical protein